MSGIARFYGEIDGSARSTASRTGTKDSGIVAHIRGWGIGAQVRLFVNEDGHDELVISLTGGSNNPNQTQVVFQDEHGKEHLVNIGQEFRVRVPKKQDIQLEFNK